MRTLNFLFLMFIGGGLFACNNNQTRHIENSIAGNLQDTLKKDSMKLKITIGEVILTASLIKSKTTEDFIKLLPLDLTMNDLFGREKYAALPKPISTGGKRSFNYEVGDIGYWSPSNDLAIYYKDDANLFQNPE
jgi:hypothetical protein